MYELTAVKQQMAEIFDAVYKVTENFRTTTVKLDKFKLKLSLFRRT